MHAFPSNTTRDYKGLHAFPSNITRDDPLITRDYLPSLLTLQGRSLTTLLGHHLVARLLGGRRRGGAELLLRLLAKRGITSAKSRSSEGHGEFPP